MQYTSGLHVVILSARLSLTLPQTAPALRIAIARWHKLWDSTSTPHDKLYSGGGIEGRGLRDPSRGNSQETMAEPGQRRQIPETQNPELRGLHKHATGLAWLATCLLDSRTWQDRRYTSLAYFRNVGLASMTDLHALMEACREL